MSAFARPIAKPVSNASSHYPLFLGLAGRRVVVVGGGSVAARKVDELLGAGARVRVVALRVDGAIRDLANQRRVELTERAFEASDLDDAWLAVAATSDPNANECVAAASEARRIFVNAVDDPSRASAFFGSIVRRGPFTIAISSDGELPALSRLLREVLEQVLPGESWVAAARTLRARWRTENVPMADRFGELVATFRKCPPPLPP